ncbi:hypothetical protein JW865_00590 [Candidatus Bathyarchaeota archaeon]|nr:hypothetical protein [Candidatus Bathyarchaeota archaeon]
MSLDEGKIEKIEEEMDEIEEEIEEKIKDLNVKLMEQKKVIDDFVKEKPYVAMGLGFVAGLGFGLILSLVKSRKD